MSTLAPSAGGQVDARKLKLDTISIIALVCAVGYMVWSISDERNSIRTEIRQLGVNLDGLAERLLARTSERWTRSDMASWCLEFRLQNPAVKCPDPHRQQVTFPENYERPPVAPRRAPHEKPSGISVPWSKN